MYLCVRKINSNGDKNKKRKHEKYKNAPGHNGNRHTANIQICDKLANNLSLFGIWNIA